MQQRSFGLVAEGLEKHSSVWSETLLTRAHHISHILCAISSKGNLQYLLSLEADLSDAPQDEVDGADESVAAASSDKEGEAGACELGIQYPRLQSIYSGKLNKQSIQVHIMYNIILNSMISLMTSHMKCRYRAGKVMLVQQTALYTITLLRHSGTGAMAAGSTR
jgi:hypothetical protein